MPEQKPAESNQDKDKEESGKSEVTDILKTIQETQKNFANDLKAIQQKITETSKPPPKEEPPKRKISEIYLEDEDKAFAELENRASTKAREDLRAEMADNQRRAQVISDLQAEFPELKQDDSPATVETLKIFNNLPKKEQTPAALELAALKATRKLGLQPLSERQVEEDDFVVGDTGGKGAGKQGKTQTRRKDEVDEKTVTLAQLMGRDPEKVKPYASRQKWSKYLGKEDR